LHNDGYYTDTEFRQDKDVKITTFEDVPALSSQANAEYNLENFGWHARRNRWRFQGIFPKPTMNDTPTAIAKFKGNYF